MRTIEGTTPKTYEGFDENWISAPYVIYIKEFHSLDGDMYGCDSEPTVELLETIREYVGLDSIAAVHIFKRVPLPAKGPT